MIYTIILFLMVFFWIHQVRMKLIDLLRKGDNQEALRMLELVDIKSDLNRKPD